MNAPQHVDWTVVEEANGIVFRSGYAGDEVVAEWEGILRLWASRTGELKALQPAPGAPGALVEKVRLGLATAFLRAQRHQHALHASAVAWEGKALVCIGASGLGKSTVAERMCRRPGVALLGDDTTGIEMAPSGALTVPPSESAVWLAAEGCLAKVPVRSVVAAMHPAALLGIVSLVFDDAVPVCQVRELRGGDAVAALLPSLVRFEKTPALWARELDFVSQVVAQTRVFQATRSFDVSADRVADALLGLFAQEVR